MTTYIISKPYPDDSDYVYKTKVDFKVNVDLGMVKLKEYKWHSYVDPRNRRRGTWKFIRSENLAIQAARDRWNILLSLGWEKDDLNFTSNFVPISY